MNRTYIPTVTQIDYHEATTFPLFLLILIEMTKVEKERRINLYKIYRHDSGNIYA